MQIFTAAEPHANAYGHLKMMEFTWAVAIFISVLLFFQSCDAFTPPPRSASSLTLDVRHTKEHHTLSNMISSGFSFSDGEQILVSLQKPLGIVLEQDIEQIGGPITVTEVNQGMYLAGVNITL